MSGYPDFLCCTALSHVVAICGKPKDSTGCLRHTAKLWPSPSCCITCCLAADSEEEEAETPKIEKETVWDWELLNDNKAIWLRSPSDVSEDEYNKFFKAVSKASLPIGSLGIMWCMAGETDAFTVGAVGAVGGPGKLSPTAI